MFQINDTIGPASRKRTVRDHDRGHILQKTIEPIEDATLGERVERRRALIKNQDPWSLQ